MTDTRKLWKLLQLLQEYPHEMPFQILARWREWLHEQHQPMGVADDAINIGAPSKAV